MRGRLVTGVQACALPIYGVVVRGAVIDQSAVSRDVVARVEIAHRLQAGVPGKGVPLGRAAPGLAGRSALVRPERFQWEGQFLLRHSTASVVMAIGRPLLRKGGGVKE